MCFGFSLPTLPVYFYPVSHAESRELIPAAEETIPSPRVHAVFISEDPYLKYLLEKQFFQLQLIRVFFFLPFTTVMYFSWILLT